MNDQEQTNHEPSEFDFSQFPLDTLFYERRGGGDRRGFRSNGPKPAPKATAQPAERRAKKERRRRIDPTTFEKQYTEDELEFMNAMQYYKVQSGKTFPSHGEVLRVALSLGYRKVVYDDPGEESGAPDYLAL
jgi:hypothetical protein